MKIGVAYRRITKGEIFVYREVCITEKQKPEVSIPIEILEKENGSNGNGSNGSNGNGSNGNGSNGSSKKPKITKRKLKLQKSQQVIIKTVLVSSRRMCGIYSVRIENPRLRGFCYSILHNHTLTVLCLL